MIKIIILTVLFVPFASLPLAAQSGMEFGPTFRQTADNPYESEKEKELRSQNVLDMNTVQNIYLGFGYATTLKFDTKEKVASWMLGSPIVLAELDVEQNAINLTPAIQEGVTNMNITIGKSTYVFLLHVVADDRVMYRRTFSMPLSGDEVASVPRVSGPPLKPQDIDVVFYISAIEKSRRDPVYFRSLQRTMKAVPQDKVYNWNGCPIYLIEAVEFPADNLIVLKIQWQNLTDNALYLDARQYEVFVANTLIPVTASSQLSSTLFPGQMDTVYLFIQGYGLNADNDFELKLPADAGSIRTLIENR